jgi:hypothetical protein
LVCAVAGAVAVEVSIVSSKIQLPVGYGRGSEYLIAQRLAPYVLAVVDIEGVKVFVSGADEHLPSATVGDEYIISAPVE